MIPSPDAAFFDTPRIASLVPSVTELLFALGLGEYVVARTGFCVHPADAVRGVPKVGGTKDVNLAKLRGLAPTHVVVNIDENRHDTAQALREFVPHLIVTHPQVPFDNLALVDQLAQAFGNVAGVAAHAAELREALHAELRLTTPEAYAPAEVLYLIWREPWMCVARDTYIAQMLARVNWQTLPAQPGGERGAARYPTLSGTEPWLARVQQVLLSSEPYAFDERHLEAARRLCPQAAVRLVDGERISWYGVRALAGLRYLRELREFRELSDSPIE